MPCIGADVIIKTYNANMPKLLATKMIKHSNLCKNRRAEAQVADFLRLRLA